MENENIFFLINFKPLFITLFAFLPRYMLEMGLICSSLSSSLFRRAKDGKVGEGLLCDVNDVWMEFLIFDLKPDERKT